ncbi:hypothetical protein BGW41_006831 [Actinomortierella wolfii]|nr:hypothetical protein BGW41_006831 [Actinomortierella wolfii]
MSLSNTAAASLAQDMLFALRDHQLADIAVTAFDKTFHLHRLILLRSGYFRSMILSHGEWVEKTRSTVHIQFDDPHVTLQAFQKILQWLYGTDYHGSDPGITPQYQQPYTVSLQPFFQQQQQQQLQQQQSFPSSGAGLGLLPASSASGEQETQYSKHYNMLYDPSPNVDELLISMFAGASYLNISGLMDEICADIGRRIRDNRGLIHYMEYAWKRNNGEAWDIILAQCMHQFFWNAYRSPILQDMLVSPEMPLAGLVKCLVAETLWVPNEYERYHFVKAIMLKRLAIDQTQLMEWVIVYHDEDWLGILQDLDNKGAWASDLNPEDFLHLIQDWEATSTDSYVDAIDMDAEWSATSKERRRSSAVSTGGMLHTMSALTLHGSSSANQDLQNEGGTDSGQGSAHDAGEDDNEASVSTPTVAQGDTKTNTAVEAEASFEIEEGQHPPLLGTPVSSPAISTKSLSMATLPRHKVRDLLILIAKFSREGLQSSPAVQQATGAKSSGGGMLHPHHHGSFTSKAKMTGSCHPSPAYFELNPNPYGLLPIRFSTSLFISRRDLFTDGKHFTSSVFYAGSWWSIQVGNNLNSKGCVGVFLSAAPVPRVVPNSNTNGSGGWRARLGSRSSAHSSTDGNGAGLFFVQQGGQHQQSQSSQQGSRNSRAGQASADVGDCSSVYSRQRELTCSYHISMTSNVSEPFVTQSSSASSIRRGLGGGGSDLVRGGSFNSYLGASKLSSNFSSSTPTLPTSPELLSGTFGRSSRVMSEDEMSGEDVFRLNEGWGYSKSNFLTRVAKYVREHPRSTSTAAGQVHSSFSMQPPGRPPLTPHPTMAQSTPQLPTMQFPLPTPQQQHGEQQQQQQPQLQPQHHAPQQQQPVQQGLQMPALQGPPPVAHQQQHAQPLQNDNSSTGRTTMDVDHEEPDPNDGLWIYFVVQVGWSERKPSTQEEG